MKLLLIILMVLMTGTNNQAFSQCLSCEDVFNIYSQIRKQNSIEYRLLDDFIADINFLKKYHEPKFLEIAENASDTDQILRYVNGIEFFDTLNVKCINRRILVSKKDYYAYINKTPLFTKDRDKKAKYYYPVIGLTHPFIFSKGEKCLLGINYFSSTYSGTFGYYLLVKDNYQWKMQKAIFQLLK